MYTYEFSIVWNSSGSHVTLFLSHLSVFVHHNAHLRKPIKSHGITSGEWGGWFTTRMLCIARNALTKNSHDMESLFLLQIGIDIILLSHGVKRNLKVVILINSLTLSIPVEQHNPTNITNIYFDLLIGDFLAFNEVWPFRCMDKHLISNS